MMLYNMYRGVVGLNCLLSDGYDVVYYVQGVCGFELFVIRWLLCCIICTGGL
jgi:hypothetical protein